MTTLLEDRFFVRSVDNSKFEKVGRIKAKSLGFDIDMTLDVNIDIFPVKERESLSVVIARHATDDDTLTPASEKSLQATLDRFDYVMYGKVFNIDESGTARRTVYASFGGLLLSLTADREVLGRLEVNMRTFIMIKHEGSA
eukprot:Polyplicarium_translucidae@DN2314_c0_g1_i2.p2